MIPAIVAFAISCTLILRLPYLPGLDAGLLCLPVVVLGLTKSGTRWMSAFILGGMIGYITVSVEMTKRLPVFVEGRDLPAKVVITELPVFQDGIARVRVEIDTPEFAGTANVSWYRPPFNLKPGQIWDLTLRLNQPTGSVNFGLFDYEAWLFAKRVHARGYVRPSPEPRFIGEAVPDVHRLRSYIRARLNKYAEDSHRGFLFALALGDTSLLTKTEWDLLAKTGTTHLMIISGLHTGLIAAAAFWFMTRVSSNPNLVVALCILFTLFYALLAGWGLPAQRAFVMSTVVVSAYGLSRNVSVLHQLCIALVCVLLLDPLVTLSNGFWLSFGAVCVLVFGMGNQVMLSRSWLTTAVRAQWVVYIGMMPMLAYLLHQIAMSAFFVNLVAIPLVAIIAVPLVLAASLAILLFEPLGHVLIEVSGFVFTMLTILLRWVSNAELMAYPGTVGLITCTVALLGSLVMLAPRGLIPRWLGLFPLLVLFKPPPTLNDGELVLTFLDVGQGLSVVAETRSSSLTYDTGPTFGTRFSAGSSIVVPFLRQNSVSRLDHLVISHRDNDHAGGIADIVNAIPVMRTVQEDSCTGSWESDGVFFYLFAAGASFAAGAATQVSNDQSCLLLIGVMGHWVLLTGDIEESAEQLLLSRQLPEMTLISSPHHGSATSSSPALLNYLQPKTVVVSAGYLNRFSHPSPEVLRRYENRNIRVYNTADDGAVKIWFTREGIKIETAREMRPAIWRRLES